MDFNFLVPKQRNDGSERSSLFRRRNYHQNHGPRGDTDLELEPVNQTSPVYADGTPMSPVNKVLLNKRLSDSIQSLSSELGEFTQEDSFQTEVSQKTQMYMIGRQEAETEVCIDRIIKTEGSKDKALLYVTSKLQRESKAQVFVNQLLNRGANPSSVDTHLWTPLHYAVKNNFRSICNRLLESEALPNVRDRDKKMPLFIAIENNNDEIAALLIAYMYNADVRGLFISDGHKDAELSFHDLLANKMEKTILSVLDCLTDSFGHGGEVRVYYHLLEADDKGRAPGDPLFNPVPKSALQIIAKSEEKTLVFHDVVRLLIRYKWKTYVRFRFQINTALYLFTLFAMVFSIIVAAMSKDPMIYDSGLDYARAVFEVWCYIFAIYVLLNEGNQLRKHKLEYFQEAFNYIDSASSILLLSMLPLRLTDSNGQWQVLATAYILWVIRIFKYAAVFRQTGAYTQILWRIVAHDFPQFTALFGVLLLAFSGSFLLALKGENILDNNGEASTFWEISFIGVRTLTEAQPVMDYAGFPPFSCFLMVGFIFTCCVVLLNILIAQLSDTYQNVQRDAQRGLEVNRALIVARSELNSLHFGKGQRIKFYKPSEDIKDMRKILSKWETPPLNELNKSIQDILETMESQNLNQLTLQNRLARQETALLQIQKQLDQLLSAQKPQIKVHESSAT
ncbi:hypothetical protein ScPMuIL_011987 [Solemya velum]